MSGTLPLLRLDATHGYFADGRGRGLQFEPADDTAVRLRRADVMSRQDGTSLWLLGPEDASEQLMAEDTSPLRWLVRATEAHFALYTADPARRPRELLLLEAPDAAEEGPGWTHGEPLATVVRVVPVALPGQTTPDVALHLDGEAAWRPPFAQLRLPPSWLRPTDLPTANAILTAATAGTDPATNAAAQAALTAATVRRGHGLPRHLRWSLPARATVWRYCLFGDWPEDALEVHDPAGAISFHPPTAERLDDGRTLLALHSRAPIVLAERSQARLQLRCRQAGLSRVLVKRLPVPGPQHLAREEIDGAATLVSEIHVHR
ncbi:hypothetical protein SAMN05216359_108109 [Roseateles sp. YR242]|uniref:hypothetical protein n=1 Tax=Roseateles sp. YR242 TaxID=1855305 RepID=UPI0008D51169|nr:hypothetical protein [Roseateles sp. YR242]SEL38290.1 hypothetical protein SAMN05216359_108109 [Roseateles sp. YR242]